VSAHAIECESCGLLQRGVELENHQRAHCVSCDGFLYHEKPRGIEVALALTLTALMLLAIANFSDFMTFEFKGRSQGNRIVTGVLMLSDVGYGPLAALILLTSVLAPLLHLSGMAAVLLPVHLGWRFAYQGPLFRRLESLRPWAMLEVYLLGIFVAVIKLGQLASIELGTAFWAYLVLILVATASYDALDARQVWEAVDLRKGETGVGRA